jgi:hypothetical protein
MNLSIRQLAFLLAPPLLSVGLLAGIASEKRTYLQPDDVEPYHARVKTAVEDIPYVIGYWTGSQKDVHPAAQKLLRPNVIENRIYVDKEPNADWRRQATLLIVHCKDSRDMVGHYPPVCYPAHGKSELGNNRAARDWQVGDMTISGTEYQFSDRTSAEEYRTTVYNFLVAPGRGVVRDMDSVKAAAEDYQKRYYGAAQFQVVFRAPALADLTRAERDEIFHTLITPTIPVIKLLSTGGLQ